MVVLFLALFLLVACSDGNNSNENFALPSSLTNGIDFGDEVTPAPAVPRVEVTPTPLLPPTFTPSVMAHQGHLYLLPVSGADGSVQYVYIVRPGDTLAGLSKFYGVSVEEVVRVNHIQDMNVIEVGDSLVIPITTTP